MTKPNRNNFCGGAFADWLEVNLIAKCNAACPWCIERDGYHPKNVAPVDTLIKRMLDTGKKNIILLGGEPTLHQSIGNIISALYQKDRCVYVTTNGILLTPDFVEKNLLLLTGINISIHDYDLLSHNEMCKSRLSEPVLVAAISTFNDTTMIRLNCNLIRGHIDSRRKIDAYIEFAKRIGANGVRFAELKDDVDNWVDMTDILGSEYGVNNDPFGLGCVTDVKINGMPVNLRQMCGLQTPLRKQPTNPEQVTKQVLYYDGQIYDGWRKKMTTEEILKRVKSGEITIPEALETLGKSGSEPVEGESESSSSGGGCCY